MTNQAYHHLLSHLNFDNKDILDIGFGTGWPEEEYLHKANSILALEKDAAEVKKMQQKWTRKTPAATFVEADITEYKLPPSSADLALFLESF